LSANVIFQLLLPIKRVDTNKLQLRILTRTFFQATNLSRKEIKGFKIAFKEFDKNGDGKIDPRELKLAMRSLGYKTSNQEIYTMIGEVDADGDGHIDFDEFVRLMTDHRGEAPSSAPGAGGSRSRAREKEIKASFKHFDEDGDGLIDVRELKSVLKSIGVKADAEEMIREVDADGDGQIDYEEFAKMMWSQ